MEQRRTPKSEYHEPHLYEVLMRAILIADGEIVEKNEKSAIDHITLAKHKIAYELILLLLQ